ncbi:MAG: hypothetical protein KC475_11725 [Cyanobacteria bacterium HKST-UBA03]|nr:hypothetical protein [Cyanobacteria bacterium HKST-UBA03]
MRFLLAGWFVILAFGWGMACCHTLTRSLDQKQALSLHWRWVLPVSWFFGALILSWLGYGGCLMAQILWPSTTAMTNAMTTPMTNGLTMAWGGSTVLLTAYAAVNRTRLGPWLRQVFSTGTRLEAGLAVGLLAIASVCMHLSCFQSGHTLYVSHAVYSDFGLHLPMVRSVSVAANIPTQLVHAAGTPIGVHFLFDALCGFLERLGLPLAVAVALPSSLSLAGAGLLLFHLTSCWFGSRTVGAVSLLLACWRSSGSLWACLFESGWQNVDRQWAGLMGSSTFLGRTPLEDWGLWTAHVWFNQRHLVFGFGLLCGVLWVAWRVWANGCLTQPTTTQQTATRRMDWKCLTRMGFLGTLVGLGGYVNGATTLATIGMVGLVGLVELVTQVIQVTRWQRPSAKRQTLLPALFLVLVVSACMVLGISKLVVSGLPMPAGFSPHLHLGFLAQNTTSLGITPWALARYAWLAFGPLPLAAVVGWWCHKRQNPTTPLTPWFWAAAMPALVAFVVQLNPQVASNHKLVTLSILLLNGWAAWLVVHLCRQPAWPRQVAGLLLAIALTITGWFDTAVLWRQLTRHVAIDLHDPALCWAMAHTPAKSRWLAPYGVLHPLHLSGRPLYLGYPYFVESAGLDWQSRYQWLAQLSQDTRSFSDRWALLESAGIDFILLEGATRNRPWAKALREHLPEAWRHGDQIILTTQQKPPSAL